MMVIVLTFNAINAICAQENSGPVNPAYLAGIIIAVFILGYLVYTLLKPDKF